MPFTIEIVPLTQSTNADLLDRLRAGAPVAEGHWLVADRQAAGRGRQGRTWLDRAGNFAGSSVVQLRAGDPSPATLAFVAGLAVYEAALPFLDDRRLLTLKWPNDLMLGQAKLAGILIEREGDAAVVGVGVNLAGAPALEGRRTASLADAGAPPSRDLFARTLAARFEMELAAWRAGGFGPVRRRWLAAAHPAGTPLEVEEAPGRRIQGRFAMLAEDGALVLRLADGTTHEVRAGDVMLGEG